MSMTLTEENPLLVLPKLAEKLNLNHAIVLQQLHFWCEVATERGHGVKHDGSVWVYKTIEEWQSKEFPFWSVSTVRRIFRDLIEKLELVETDFLSSAKWNRTLFYRINHEKFTGLLQEVIQAEQNNIIALLTSRNLTKEKPLLILPKLAVKIGLNNAIVLQQLHFWCQIATENGHGVKHDGSVWIYKTIEEWQSKDFPFWSTPTIRRIFKDLIERNLIESEYLNHDKWNRTLFYKINQENFAIIIQEMVQHDRNSIISDYSNAYDQGEQMGLVKMNTWNLSDQSYVTENTTENTTKNIHTQKLEKNDSFREKIINLWTPDIHVLNSILTVSQLPEMNQSDIDFVLFHLNSHYMTQLENGRLQPKQMYAKFVNWISQDLSRFKKSPKDQTKPNSNTSQNVNSFHKEENSVLQPVKFDREEFERELGLLK